MRGVRPDQGVGPKLAPFAILQAESTLLIRLKIDGLDLSKRCPISNSIRVILFFPARDNSKAARGSQGFDDRF
jgi:hypothetical protein